MTARTRPAAVRRLAVLPWVTAILVVLASTAIPQGGSAAGPFSIAGTIVDRLTRLPLPGARVVIDEAGASGVTDSTGAFSIDLPGPGLYRVRASALRYATSPWVAVELTPAHAADVVRIELEPQAYEVPAIDVYGERYRAARPEQPTSTLLASDIRRAPAGFQDPLRAIQESRSVESRNDLGTLITIRGGEPDQILFQMDGFDVYNPYRMRIVLGGGLSLANPDMVEAVEMYAGGYSARYGNRTTGLINMRTREGNRLGVRTRATVSLIAASAAAEGPIAGGRGSWIVGGRRTFYDILIRPPKGEGTQYPFLQELQGRVDLDVTRTQRLTLRASIGDEGVDVVFKGEESDQGADTDGGSTTGSVSVEHALDVGSDIRATTRLALLGDRTRLEILGTEDQLVYADARTNSTRFSSSHELDIRRAPHLLRLGASLDRYVSDVNWSAEGNPSPTVNPSPERLDFDNGITYGALHVEDLLSLQRGWVLSFGVRMEDASGPSPLQASPRVALRGPIVDGLRLQIGAGQFLQYPDGIQAFSREASLNLEDMENLSPENAQLASIGLAGTHGRFDWTTEAYTRDTRRLLVPLNRETYDAASEGSALARGVELEAGISPAPPDRREGLLDRAEFRVAHAWIDSRFRGGIFRNWTPVTAEREHSFLARTRFPAGQFDIAVVGRVASGAPYTPLKARITQRDAKGDLYAYAVWGRPFSARTAAYGRVDVRIERPVTIRGKKGMAFLEVINLTNRKNTVSMVWDNELSRLEPVRGLPLFPFIGVTIWG